MELMVQEFICKSWFIIGLTCKFYDINFVFFFFFLSNNTGHIISFAIPSSSDMAKDGTLVKLLIMDEE